VGSSEKSVRCSSRDLVLSAFHIVHVPRILGTLLCGLHLIKVSDNVHLAIVPLDEKTFSILLLK
jgi:hypothetical protein